MAVSAFHNSKETILMWTGSSISGTDFEKIDDNAQFHLTPCYSEDVYSEVVKDFQQLKFESSDNEGLLSVWLQTGANNSTKIGLLTITKTRRVSFLAMYRGALTDEQKFVIAKKIIEELPKVRAGFDAAKRIADTRAPDPGILDMFGLAFKANVSYLLSSTGGQVRVGTNDASERALKSEIEEKLNTGCILC